MECARIHMCTERIQTVPLSLVCRRSLSFYFWISTKFWICIIFSIDSLIPFKLLRAINLILWGEYGLSNDFGFHAETKASIYIDLVFKCKWLYWLIYEYTQCKHISGAGAEGAEI